jgi:hypothetical protein
MGNSYPAKIGTKLGDCAGPNYRPDGRVHPGHLTGLQKPTWRPIPRARNCEYRVPVCKTLNPAQPANAAPVRSGFAICPSTCESRSGELFLHRVVISRSAGPQLQGGDPGFVKLTGPSSLEFPDYDANFMYRTLGNITKNPKIGLLFMAFDRKTYRIRINGRASTRGDAESLGRHWGAKAVIRVECLAYTRIVRAMY